MPWNILTPRPLQDAAHEILDDFAEVTVTTTYDTETALDADIDRYDAIILKSLQLPRKRLKLASNLKVISQSGVGLDPVDIEAATEFGTIVCNNLGANTRAVAEHTITAMLAIRKNLLKADADIRRGVWQKHGYLAPELDDDILGVFGCGNIGSLVTEFADGLGMQCIAYDPYQAAEDLPDSVEKVEEAADLFTRADVVCVHAPLTEETRGAIGTAELNALGSDGILINVARGAIVNEDALVTALQEDVIHGAGLDVFSEEPIPADHPLIDCDNVILTPHMAGSTLKSVPAKDRGAAEHIRMVYEGRIPDTVVNLDALALQTAYGGDISENTTSS